MKPRGWLFLTTPNLAAWFNRISLLFGYQPVFTEVSDEANARHLLDLEVMPAGHIRLFTYRALREVIERNGWKVRQARGIGMNPNLHKMLPVRLFNFIFQHPALSSGIGILAQRARE